MLNPHVLKVHIPAHILGLVGIALIAAFPSWYALLGFMLANIWFSCLGMSIGFHRYFAHRAFKTSRFWHYVQLIGGTLAGQGSVIFWVALHRLHHPSSDRPGDVHSPVDGFWHSYMGWIFTLDPKQVPMSRAADLIKDPACRFTHRHYTSIMWVWWTLMITLAFIAPALAGGILLAGMWSIHQEALINSVCHDERFGERGYGTQDNSRDVHWLKWLTWGQSLHNTHHSSPAMANFGGTNGTLDPGYSIIKRIAQ
jgi:fatty-acid desaturase